MQNKVGFGRELLIICSQCNTESCHLHGNVHPGTLCSEMNADDAASERLIPTITNKCPGCGVNIEKNGGCNHGMRACNCNISFFFFHFCFYRLVHTATEVGRGKGQRAILSNRQ